MLRRFLILAVMLGALPSTARAQSEADDAVAESESAVTFDSFQGPLATYGEWVDVGSYGWAWRPFRVAAGWRPYLYGHWAWTDDGWLWVSDEPYGWATYHYGRWAFEPGWGWVWVPGYEWGPAWVDWRYNDGCVGWFPMYPLGYVPSSMYYEHWTFVPWRHFGGRSAHEVAYTPDEVRHHWGSTTVSAGGVHRASPALGGPTVPQSTPMYGGPLHSFAEKHLGHGIDTVRPVSVNKPEELGRSHGAGEVPVFRPPRTALPPRPAGDLHPAGPPRDLERRPTGPAPRAPEPTRDWERAPSPSSSPARPVDPSHEWERAPAPHATNPPGPAVRPSGPSRDFERTPAPHATNPPGPSVRPAEPPRTFEPRPTEVRPPPRIERNDRPPAPPPGHVSQPPAAPPRMVAPSPPPSVHPAAPSAPPSHFNPPPAAAPRAVAPSPSRPAAPSSPPANRGSDDKGHR